jgi:hypothetical protein
MKITQYLKKQIHRIQAYQSTWYIGYKELLAQLFLLFCVAFFEPIEPSFIILKGQKNFTGMLE